MNFSSVFPAASQKLNLLNLEKDVYFQEAEGFMSSGEKSSWPELVGMNGKEAKTRLQSILPDKQVLVIPADSMVTMDYRTDRIRIFVDGSGNVERPPSIG